jgi:DNA repair protein SbcC/Rad50
MKIVQLRFKNLNSLTGEWSIDFTAQEFISDGIFAISGPTGAGKSTILDAICLALYGRTPRLSSISKATNEIMSRQTGECFAEVTFETKEGTFRAHWSQKRARNKAEGALQNPLHEISEAETGKILASQIKTTEAEVLQKTGMDYKRFTQSMMLAQGRFAAFLQATGDERAPMLEQITGTDIYSRISMFVFEKQKSEKIFLEKLQSENSGIVLLTTEEEQQVRTDLDEKTIRNISISIEKERLGSAIEWLSRIAGLKSEIELIESESKALLYKINEFAPRRMMLQSALRAANLEGTYASVISLRKQQHDDTLALTSLLGEAPDLQTERDKAQILFETSGKEYAEFKKEHEALLTITREVRLVDQMRSQKKLAAEETKSEINRYIGEKESENLKREKAEKKILDLKTETEKINSYLGENQPDSGLASEMTGISISARELAGSKKALLESEKNFKALSDSFGNKKKELEQSESELGGAAEKNRSDKNNLIEAGEALGKLLDGSQPEEILKRKDSLLFQLADLKKIAGFETERLRLEDDKACPLCGSLHHPYAEGNIPTVTETEKEFAGLISLIEKTAALNRSLDDLKNIERLSEVNLSAISNKRNLLLQQKTDIEENLTRQKSELETYRTNCVLRSESLQKLLSPFGITDLPTDLKEMDLLLDSLEARKLEWQKHGKRKAEIDGEILLQQNVCNISDALIRTKSESIGVKIRELEEIESSLGILNKSRTDLFGEKSVENEEAISSGKLAENESLWSKASSYLLHCEQNLARNTTRISDLRNEIDRRKPGLEHAESTFFSSLKELGFQDEVVFVSCRLPSGEREILQKEAEELDNKRTELAARKTDRERSLTAEEIKKLSEESQDILEVKLRGATLEVENILKETGALNQKLDDNNKARIRGAEVLHRIEIQKAVYDSWAKLNSLIGSADGKKYRNFAQGLTFGIMVSHANSQLVKLSDRYLLIRDKDEPLELSIIDNYQGGEIRTTKNLSGGESFIVSLALALGLSRMSGRTIRVDSLFLDEGFATLDEEALETALGTLAGLRQEGKMIGIISHIGALKDRIGTKINVQPVREGRSILTGPGCNQII